MVEYESGKDKYPYYPIYSIEEIRAVDGYEVTYSVEKNDKDVYPFDETGNIVITCTGEAIPEDVVKVNINKEREAGGTSLEDAVANQVGYENQSKFATAFRDVLKIAPAEYRKQNSSD